jgi:uncharacterized protein YdhG (YjbR/CyaY superfamily)
MAKAVFKSVDEYIASQPKTVRDVLKSLRNAIRKAVPTAREVILYNMPTYLVHGKRVVQFAVWKQHYSIYGATPPVEAAFRVELAPYQVDRGTIRFPVSAPVPVKLIGQIARFRVKTMPAARPRERA